MKKNNYKDPAMPDSLKELFELEIEDFDSYRYAKKHPVKNSRPPSSAKKKTSTGGSKARPKKTTRPTTKKPTTKKPVSKRPKAKRIPEESRKRPTSKKVVRKTVKKPGKKPVNRPVNRPVKKTSKKPINRRSRKRTVRKKSRFSLLSILKLILVVLVIGLEFIIIGPDEKEKISENKKKKLDNKFYKVIPTLFLAILVLTGAIFIVSPKQEKSLAENRPLQQKPKFTISGYLNGSYAKDDSKYLSDQFPERDKFIKLKAKMDRIEGQKEINGVYICKDGYLMEGFKRGTEENMDRKAEVINKFAEKNPSLNVSLMLVPNKAEIYKHLLPKNTPNDSQTKYLTDIKSKLDNKINFIDVIGPFKKTATNKDLYFKTDHHWTVEGAYVAYKEYCNSVGLEPVNLNSYNKSLASDDFKGSLYYKNGAQIGEGEKLYLNLKSEKEHKVLVKYDRQGNKDAKKVTTLYEVDKLKSRDPYEVFTGGNHNKIRIRTSAKSDRRLLLIKDSYANSMLPYLINNFSEIIVIDPRYFSESMEEVLKSYDVTDVLMLYNVNTFNTDTSILSIID